MSLCACTERVNGALFREVRRCFEVPVGRANDVRIDCKAAKHSDGDRGAVLAPYRYGRAGTAPPSERGVL